MRPSDVLRTNESANVFPFEVCNLLLGRGGSGQVFLGRIGSSDKYVAIKKRYGRYHANGNTTSYIHAKRSEPFCPSQETKVQPSQNAFYSPGGNYLVCRNGSGLQQLEFGDGALVSQRRELDLGEESVSQTAAIFQQQGSCTLDAHSDNNTTQALVPSLMDEVSILSYIGPHPQIVRFLGSYTTSKNTNFFTMELMDSDVGRELKEGNTSLQDECVCAAIAYSVLLALDELHSHAVAHRDVKPGNILLKRLTEAEEWACVHLATDDSNLCLLSDSSNESYAKPRRSAANLASSELVPGIRQATSSVSYVKATLGDFSAAHSTSCLGDASFSDTCGTLHYKSPEQLMGRRSIVLDNFTSVDLWGLGCTLYEMATGTRPFAGNSELQVLMSILDALGSGIQSYPAATRHVTLFDDISVSPGFADFLRCLLSLDPARRCTAKEALCHPFLASMRDSTSRFSSEEHQKPTDRTPRVIGIPMTLKYASLIHIPELRFSRISRTPLKKKCSVSTASSAPVQSHLSACPVSLPVSGAEVTTFPDLAEDATAASATSKDREGNGWDNGATATSWRHEQSVEDQGEKQTPFQRPQLQHCLDTTATSFFSDSSYLHWSEIRPPPGTSAPPQSSSASQPLQRKEEIRSSSISSRAVALFGNAAVGNTPSPSTSANGQQQQLLPASMDLKAGTESRNTVSRALNISDSSMKDMQAERSGSHVDFDLSPLLATQLFGTDEDAGVCPVPHPIANFLPRRAQPVLHLASGSTFTASNLRANSSFERESFIAGRSSGNGVCTTSAFGVLGPPGATFAGRCSTPRQHQGRRPTAFAGRMLCFSEETDPLIRRSGGSSACRPSSVNSLATSPAPLGGVVVEECSPQPSPIRPMGVATRSSSGLPVVADPSRLSSDDSGVALEWIGVPSPTAAGHASVASGAPEATPTTTSAQVGDVSRGGGDSASVLPMLSSIRLQSSQSVRYVIPANLRQSEKSPCIRWSVSRLESAPGDSLHMSECTTVDLRCAAQRRDAFDLPDASCGDQPPPPKTSLISAGDGIASGLPMLPLPIPLSVAAVCQRTAQSARAPLSRPCTPTSRALHETPRTQRFSCPMSALRTGCTGPNGQPEDHSKPQGALTTCVQSGNGVSSTVPFLCNQDVNAQTADLAHKGCSNVGPPGSSSCLAPRFHVAAATPLTSLKVCAYSYQLHTTPSSGQLAVEEVPLSINCDGTNNLSVGTKVSSIRTVAVVRAPRLDPSTVGPHTPLPVISSRSPSSQHCRAPLFQLSPTSLDSGHRSVRSHEGECTETPRSKQRGSMKRAREEMANREDSAAVRQRADGKTSHESPAYTYRTDSYACTPSA